MAWWHRDAGRGNRIISTCSRSSTSSSTPSLLGHPAHHPPGFVSVMEPALTAVFQPLVDVFTWIGTTLASLFLPVLDVLHTAFALVGNILWRSLPLYCKALHRLPGHQRHHDGILTHPAVGGQGFTILMSPLQYVADLLSWLGSWVQYLGSVLPPRPTTWCTRSGKKSYASSPDPFPATPSAVCRACEHRCDRRPGERGNRRGLHHHGSGKRR